MKNFVLTFLFALSASAATITNFPFTNTPIGSLPSTNVISGSDVLPMVVGGNTRKVTADTVAGFVTTNLNSTNINVTSVQLRRWNVKDFGALGNASNFYSATIAAGSTNLTLPAAFSTLTTNDIGKIITISAAGPGGRSLTTHITSVAATNSAGLSNAAPTGGTNVFGAYGYDDTAAVQRATEHVVTTNRGGTVYFPAGIYLIAGPIVGPNTNWSVNNTKNAQLYTPNITEPTLLTTMLAFEGPISPNPRQYVLGEEQKAGAYGAVLWSTITNYSGGALFACAATNVASTIYSNGAVRTNWMSPLHVAVRRMTFRLSDLADGTALDLSSVPTADVQNVLVDTGYGLYNAPQPTSTNMYGIKFPEPSSGGNSIAVNTYVQGFYNGYSIGEHFWGTHMAAFSCDAAVSLYNAGGHHAEIALLDAEDCKRVFRGGLAANTIYANVTTEVPDTNRWTYPNMLADDPNSAIRGIVTYENTVQQVELTNNGGAFITTIFNKGPATPLRYTSTLYGTNFEGGSFVAKGTAFGYTVYGNTWTDPARILLRSGESGTNYFVIEKREDAFGTLIFNSSTNSGGSVQTYFTLNPFDGRLTLDKLSITNLPGTGTNVVVDASGNLYRSNIVNGSDSALSNALGTMAWQNSNAVDVTGGTIAVARITNATVHTTNLIIQPLSGAVTAGQVWTATATNGTGAWSNSAAGGYVAHTNETTQLDFSPAGKLYGVAGGTWTNMQLISGARNAGILTNTNAVILGGGITNTAYVHGTNVTSTNFQAVGNNVANPVAYGFANDVATGFYRPVVNEMFYASAGNPMMGFPRLTDNFFRLRNTTVLSWTTGDPSGTADDTMITNRGAGVLVIRSNLIAYSSVVATNGFEEGLKASATNTVNLSSNHVHVATNTISGARFVIDGAFSATNRSFTAMLIVSNGANAYYLTNGSGVAPLNFAGGGLISPTNGTHNNTTIWTLFCAQGQIFVAANTNYFPPFIPAP